MGSSDSDPGRSREPRAGWASSWHPYRSCALLRYRLSGAASFSAERPIRLGRSSPAPRPARKSLAGMVPCNECHLFLLAQGHRLATAESADQTEREGRRAPRRHLGPSADCCTSLCSPTSSGRRDRLPMPTRQAKCATMARVGSAEPPRESGLAVQRGLRFAQWPRGIDLRPSCRPPTGRCVGPTHSLRSLRDAKVRSVNGPLRRCRREPGHLLLLVPALRVRAQRTRIGTVPVQRMPMSVFLPHGRKDGTPDPEVVRADGRGQVS